MGGEGVRRRRTELPNHTLTYQTHPLISQQQDLPLSLTLRTTGASPTNLHDSAPDRPPMPAFAGGVRETEIFNIAPLMPGNSRFGTSTTTSRASSGEQGTRRAPWDSSFHTSVSVTPVRYVVGMDTKSSTTEILEQQLIEDEAVIARARGRQMTVLRELDRRQVALRDGHRSLKEWATGRMDLAPETAGVLVSTARRLEDLPDVDAAVTTGEIGFDRAVAVGRLAGRDDALDLLSEAADYDIQGIRVLVVRRRRMSRLDEIQAFEERYVSIQPNLDESAWRLSGQLPGCAGRTVVAALETRGDTFPYGQGVTPTRTTRNADALWSITHDAVAGSDGASIDASTPVLTVFVDATEAAPTNGTTGITLEAGPRVGANAVEAILCNGIVEVIARTPGGQPLALGRRSRVIPPRLRRFVLHRDGGRCTVSGCTSRYRLQVHHIVPWSHNGRSDSENLTTLCWFHHHIVIHGQGHRIDPSSPPQRHRLLHPRIHAPPTRARATTGRQAGAQRRGQPARRPPQT